MSDERQARIAFIGAGRHATNLLYPCLAQIPEIDLVAVCDLQEDLARRNARTFGARRWYTDADRMLDEEKDLDGVAVIGIPQMMKELGEKVLRRRGLPIFVEKPPAINVHEAEAFAATAAEAGAWGQVAFMKRFAAAYVLAKQTVDSDWFGPVSTVAAKFTNGDYPPIWGIESGGLSFLTGQAVHMFDLIQYFAGPVKEVYARYLERSSASHGFAVTVVFESGALGTLNLNSFESWQCFDEYLSISGEHNYLTVDDMLYVNVYREEPWAELDRPGLVRNFSQSWRPAGSVAPDMRMLIGYRDELKEFARCLLEGQRPGPDLEAGAAAMRVGQAIWDSSQSGKPVTLP
ncbi:MAG: Gfo/Idh/MocA family protein [Anaerolineae bacterium]|jgi:myo-inositol 2-dehydrogenase/D-chiro-inositol 1-dehydrogenase